MGMFSPTTVRTCHSVFEKSTMFLKFHDRISVFFLFGFPIQFLLFHASCFMSLFVLSFFSCHLDFLPRCQVLPLPVSWGCSVSGCRCFSPQWPPFLRSGGHPYIYASSSSRCPTAAFSSSFQELPPSREFFFRGFLFNVITYPVKMS